MLASVWLYGAWLGWDWRPLTTAFGLLFLYALLHADRRTWFWSGFFIGLLWFGWIGVSFIYYHMAWAIPIVLIVIGLAYGGIFWGVAWVAERLPLFLSHHGGQWHTLPAFRRGGDTTEGSTRGAPTYADALHNDEQRHALHSLQETILPSTLYPLPSLILKSVALLSMSYLHPLGFDWFKPELVFVHSYLGILKWQMALILLSIILALWRNRPLWLLLVVLAYSPTQVQTFSDDPNHAIKLVTTHTTIADKWNPDKIPDHIRQALRAIDDAIAARYQAVVLPESVFPFFLNRRPKILGALLKRSQKIDIIIGALYWDHGIHRNSTYHFHQGHYTVADKVILVPFGEANPLPQWASRWVNRIFFDGAVDYQASADPTDWVLNGQKYRNAICYEATSERLYDPRPDKMIVTSNNAWFVPSIEPTFQRLLLSYYVRKYGTTIYHATNRSRSYVLRTRH